MINLFKNWSLSVLTILNLICLSCNAQNNSGQENQSSSFPEVENDSFDAYKSIPFGFPDFSNQINQCVRTIYEDSKGIYWFGTESGLFKLENDSLIFIDSLKSYEGGRVTIKDITEDTSGTIWVGHTGGISSISKIGVKNIGLPDGPVGNDVWCVAADSKNRLWVGTYNGMYTLQENQLKYMELPEGKIDTTLGVSSKKMIHSVFEDSKKNIWICSNAGLFKLNNDSLHHFSKEEGIETNFVNEVFEDSQGRLWVSSKEGLYLIEDSMVKNVTKNRIVKGKGIGSVAEDVDGNIWFVSNQHQLYYHKNDELIEFIKSKNNKGPVIFELYKDSNGRLWTVGFGGAYRLEDMKFINITRFGPW